MGDYAKHDHANKANPLAGQINPYASVYGGSGSTGGSYTDSDMQVKRQIGPGGISLGGHPTTEQTMRFECLKIAAGMNGNENVQLLMMTAESLLKWIRGN